MTATGIQITGKTKCSHCDLNDTWKLYIKGGIGVREAVRKQMDAMRDTYPVPHKLAQSFRGVIV